MYTHASAGPSSVCTVSRSRRYRTGTPSALSSVARSWSSSCHTTPCTCGTVERLDGGDAALVDQPVVVGERRGPRIGGVGAAPRHLLHAQVRPVREVAVRVDIQPVRTVVIAADQLGVIRAASAASTVR